MTRLTPGPKTIVSAVLAGLLLFSGLAWQSALAQGTPRAAGQPPARPEALATTLSYYFIAGGTFTPNSGGAPYSRQVTDCVNQMPLAVHMLAPVHLPQASQVVSMTLFTYDNIVTTTFSTGYFNSSDGQGGASIELSADSDSGVIGYQHHQNVTGSPVTIDNQNKAYEVEWRKVPQEGESDSPFLSLCGIRLAYYAPLSATFLPALEK